MKNSYNNECPDCGTPNFTTAGLKSHRGNTNCQKRRDELIAHLWGSSITGGPFQRALRILPADILRKAADEAMLKNDHDRENAIFPFITEKEDAEKACREAAALTIVPNAPSAPEETQDRTMGEQLEAQYQKAVGGMREVVLFGAMMLRLKAHLGIDSARGANSSGAGRYNKGTGLKGWLPVYAPTVSEATAYRFMAVAEAVQAEFKLPKKLETTLGFAGLLTTPAEELPEAARAKQLELFEFVDGTSQRSWLDKLRPKNQGGGSREKKDVPPPTPEEALAKLTNDTRAWVDDVFTGPLKARHWRLLEDTENLALASYFEEQAKALREWLKVPQRDRSAIALEDLH